MSSGAGGEEPQPSSPELDALRTRLYAPDSTAADRAAYDAALAEASTGRPGPAEAPPAVQADPTSAEEAVADSSPAPTPAPRPRRTRALTAAVLAVALLLLGAAIGAGASSINDRSAAPTGASTTSHPPTVTTAPPLPTPVAARTLPIRASARQSAAAALAQAFAGGTDDAAVDRAVQLIGSGASDSTTDFAWMERHACSSSTGIVRPSLQGRPVVLTPTDSALQLPAHSHFRISIYLKRPAGWSWVLSAARGTTSDAPIAVGAGSPEAGTVQYAEFDATGSGDLTRVAVSSTNGTPFLWQLDSCITGG